MPPKRRRRFQGLYYHSSPPKVMPMNGQAGNQNGRKRRDNDDFSVKLSTIRIWMHEKEIGKLTRILWAGQGNRLCQQASNNARVKRFLGAVPHVMNAIKELHQAVIDNNLETVQAKLEPPVPPALATCKDGNGLNIVHKAAGLGHTKILEYLIGIWPEGAHETDITGKTALHWAASAKNNMRCYTLLTQAGCDEEALDYKMKTPSYYRHKPHEIERAFLVYVPEAPRVSPTSVTDWEALSDDSQGGDEGSKKLDIKIPPPLNGSNGRSLAEDSAEIASDWDTNEGTSANEEEDFAKPEEQPPDNGVESEAEVEAEIENIARAVSADKAEDQAEEVKGDEEVATAEPEADDTKEKEIEASDMAENTENTVEKETEAEVEAEVEQNGEPEQNGETVNELEASENEKTEAQSEQAKVDQNGAAKDDEDDYADNMEDDVKDDEKDDVKDDEKDDVEDDVEDEVIEDQQLRKQDTLEADEQTLTKAPSNDKEAVGDDEEEEDDDEDIIGGPEPSFDLNEIQNEQLPEPDTDGADSPTSSLAIEGFVQGASEDYTVQSQTAAFEVDEDARIQQIITSGDMEQLAEIVLNGEGGRLLGLQTEEPEIQAFLNNVPSYMEKIHRVHNAARDGSLLSLQQALDRRKFAIAKDDMSPNGATPLHVAVLFGHSDIVRYLASRFPETMEITDNDGRTALHYAATIKDNGHFYNVMSQLGGNTKAIDKLGHTPIFYLDNEKSRDILTYSELLNIYGAEEMENQLLSDQGKSEHVNFQGNPIFKTEQGKYLADTLADPLIKALTEIANKRPKDPVAYLTGYLQNFMFERKPIADVQVHSSSSKTSSTALALSNPSPASQSQPMKLSRGNAHHADAIEVDVQSLAEEQEAMAQHLEERDEHGQSMLHFACARSHRRGALYTLIEESHIDVTYRDELYRTARDVALQANQPSNAAEIDRYILAQAAVGDVAFFENLTLQGYDHVLDIEDDNGKSIIDVAAERQNEALVEYFQNLRTVEETREEIHQMIRENNMERVREITSKSNAKWAIQTKNYYGRTALHIAVLKESEETVQHLVKICPEAMKVTDNLERTVLHYAMGTNALETLSRILIQNGSKRTAKDLKGRQPSYYFMNKADILRLQEEEEENR